MPQCTMTSAIKYLTGHRRPTGLPAHRSGWYGQARRYLSTRKPYLREYLAAKYKLLARQVQFTFFAANAEETRSSAAAERPRDASCH